MKKIAMIPARLGSTRVPRKNLRFLGDKPLMAWVTETARDSGLFDAVVVNTEAEEIAALAESLGVGVFRRDPALSADHMTSEHFVRDFLERTPDCGELYQVTPTSPFLGASYLRDAMRLLCDGPGTVVSVRRVQAECLDRNGRPVNFDATEPMRPSQTLRPVWAFCNGVFGWRREAFLRSGCFGGGRFSILTVEGDSGIDIDTEADFAEAEAVLAARRTPTRARYWTPEHHEEADAALVTQRDGIAAPFERRLASANVFDYLRDEAWKARAMRVMEMPSSSATLITQMPGEGNRRHYHPDCDEWWLILEGEYRYEIDGQYWQARKGDIIGVRRGLWHQITAVGHGPATRLAVSRDGVRHVYHD